MKAIVTGSSGFLGRRVVTAMMRVGYTVHGLDLANGQSVRGDILAASEGATVVCHLAAIGDVYECQRDPTKAAEANVVDTCHVVEACLRNGARLVHASTWEVRHPDEPYAITKAAAENIVRDAVRRRGLSAMCLRLGSAYGPDMRASQVIRKFIDMAREGKPLTIHGDGSQFRQWTHADDIADAFVLAAASTETGSVHVVGEEAVTIRSLAEMIGGRYGVPVSFGEPRPSDVPSEYVDTTDARKALGWAPRRRFAEELGGLMAS